LNRLPSKAVVLVKHRQDSITQPSETRPEELLMVQAASQMLLIKSCAYAICNQHET
jgi:hypothetical protein